MRTASATGLVFIYVYLFVYIYIMNIGSLPGRRVPRADCVYTCMYVYMNIKKIGRVLRSECVCVCIYISIYM
jgi:hypothetical protein